jgi:CheY-like chemotaxis protein
MSETEIGKQPAAARILLVEDNDADVYLLEKALRHRKIPYELTHYHDGEQAIQALSEDNCPIPDLILLDLNLPRHEGFEVLRIIRARSPLVGVSVGILTSSNDQKDRHRVALIGAERYIHKPVTLEEFIDQVGQAVEEMLTV